MTDAGQLFDVQQMIRLESPFPERLGGSNKTRELKASWLKSCCHRSSTAATQTLLILKNIETKEYENPTFNRNSVNFRGKLQACVSVSTSGMSAGKLECRTEEEAVPAPAEEKRLGTAAVHGLPGCCGEGLARVGDPAVTNNVLPGLTCLPDHEHLSWAELGRAPEPSSSSA